MIRLSKTQTRTLVTPAPNRAWPSFDRSPVGRRPALRSASSTVVESKSGKKRWHLDLAVTGTRGHGEVGCCGAPGTTKLARHHEHGQERAGFADSEGGEPRI